MRLAARFLLLLVVLAVVPIAFFLPAGCSGQGEGERCDVHGDNNGNDDCAGDLVCTPAGSLNSSSTDRCCPADRNAATTLVCQLPARAGGIDASPPPPDAGSDAPAPDAPLADAPVADAPAQADAPADAPLDAPVDAPEDGG